MKKRLIFGGIAGVALIGAVGGALLFQTSDLDRIHAGIAATHNNVEHIAADDFVALDSDEFVLFDVREADEFAVSHLPGAVLVDPDITAAEFTTRFGDSLEGKRAIFYCSVGVRSSNLADRVAELVEDSTGNAPVNLIGGLFKWRNEGRELVTASGQSTGDIHPYDDYWGRLIEDRETISYKPET
ncbi:MAG: sulfurtransferase [Erythrobacteraceae bacterium]|nr:sulfurtransferase [Erythrobacteraceae bacterium]|tara:strand:- start:239 stop:793 length:555 start_codon:yes stop_codon:yes gene_type:complete